MSNSFHFVPLIVFVLACEMALSPCISLGQSPVEDSSHQRIDPAVLLEKPPAVPGHLRELFDRMEAANRRSQDVFRKLSTAQMNFQPSNGTHTPRWNAEHMAGRQHWSGKEEARAMQRVDDFCRRYAHLLETTALDAKPPATNWPSLRALLLQMERHYDEHTANVVKKFELPDWPEQ